MGIIFIICRQNMKDEFSSRTERNRIHFTVEAGETQQERLRSRTRQIPPQRGLSLESKDQTRCARARASKGQFDNLPKEIFRFFFCKIILEKQHLIICSCGTRSSERKDKWTNVTYECILLFYSHFLSLKHFFYRFFPSFVSDKHGIRPQ